MKIITSSLLVLGLLAVQVSEANAVVCARGPHRAGCAGPRGAAVAHRPYGYGGQRWCAARLSTDGGTSDLRGPQLARHGWIVVSMKDDCERIFEFE